MKPVPEAVVPPSLQDQFEELLHAVWQGEANERFMDRINLACGLGVTAPTVHRCSPPAATDNDQEWECPDCDRRWKSALWSRHWDRVKIEHPHRCALPVGSPVSHQVFGCPECGRRWECRWLSTHWLPAEG